MILTHSGRGFFMTDIIVYLLGGFLAGVATGLIGLSTATIIAPLFATVLGMNPYMAIGIALASDVFASAFSAGHYIIHKNIQLKSAIVMAVTVVIFTIGASYFSKDTNPTNHGIMINALVILLGLRFLVFPIKDKENAKIFKFTKSKFLSSVFWGAIIGATSGYFGVGGGLSMLALLTMVLGYNLKSAVGTSVFIMVFTAFVGAATHIAISGTDWLALIITSVAALIGANISAIFANRINQKTLNYVIGSLLFAFGVTLTLVYLIP